MPIFRHFRIELALQTTNEKKRNFARRVHFAKRYMEQKLVDHATVVASGRTIHWSTKCHSDTRKVNCHHSRTIKAKFILLNAVRCVCACPWGLGSQVSGLQWMDDNLFSLHFFSSFHSPVVGINVGINVLRVAYDDFCPVPIIRRLRKTFCSQKFGICCCCVREAHAKIQ